MNIQEYNNMTSIDDEWTRFMNVDNDDSGDDIITNVTDLVNNNKSFDKLVKPSMDETIICPKASELYISTKSMIGYLCSEIDLADVFWKIPIISYSTPDEGIIKKQMKFNSSSQEQLDDIYERLKHENYYTDHVISSIINPLGRVKFKDIRKINVGISSKDIMSYRIKQKGAFYNCFVIMLRLKYKNIFKEFHVKIFNTGKVEIPGIQNNEMYQLVLVNVLKFLKPYTTPNLHFKDEHITILVNSNFNCGFYIMRETLYDILRGKYNIQCIYDPCSYPGVQCKYYYDNRLEVTEQTGMVPANTKDVNITKVSFMVFRTGSILIVGMCNDDVLNFVYRFIKQILITEFPKINQRIIGPDDIVNKDKRTKVRKLVININPIM